MTTDRRITESSFRNRRVLGLREQLFAEETEEKVRKDLVKAARARNILENEDFKWWWGSIFHTHEAPAELRQFATKLDDLAAAFRQLAIELEHGGDPGLVAKKAAAALEALGW